MKHLPILVCLNVHRRRWRRRRRRRHGHAGRSGHGRWSGNVQRSGHVNWPGHGRWFRRNRSRRSIRNVRDTVVLQIRQFRQVQFRHHGDRGNGGGDGRRCDGSVALYQVLHVPRDAGQVRQVEWHVQLRYLVLTMFAVSFAVIGQSRGACREPR